ncbi:Fungal specific transcription factor domain [Teratosphaeria destructans]|uniref:Fungal specific transcription factor domain n=1 Tax=Teratosphaeria destructans TaxID=418781 RepID=A0A9W7W3R2_9PEZI|nr:Fungal specific transcription factor domain [Teratosphaeria destructans]
MDPDGSPTGQDHDLSEPKPDEITAAQAVLKARLARKRTKTGCLTCRKRRIKCGEERPVCKNCIKSKRHCEGYNQRVIFRPPTFDYRPAPHGGAHITFHAGPATPSPISLPEQYGDQSAHTQLRPRPVDQPPYGAYYQPLQDAPRERRVHLSYGTSHGGLAAQRQPAFASPDGHAHQPPSSADTPITREQTQEFYALAQRHEQPDPLRDHQHVNSYDPVRIDVPPVAPFAMPATQSYPAAAERYWHSTAYQPVSVPIQSPRSTQSSATVTDVLTSNLNSAIPSSEAPRYVPRPELQRPIDSQEPILANAQSVDQSHTPSRNVRVPQYGASAHMYNYQVPATTATDTTHSILTQAAVEVHDDDYYDIDSDEEMDIDTTALIRTDDDRQRTFSGILHGNHIPVEELQMRRYDTFIYNNMLDTYNVEEHASPLRNPATARVFAHFIAVTGPSLSIFERHPRNTSVLFTEGTIPFSQQGLWTYTMPMAALHHQGLLHAMLALASLHIARLKGASATPSMQHYAWALKRVHHCVGEPKKRLKLTTIAASMLLGFYEIMTADHMKWNTHLSGTSRLFIETDFARMTQQYRQSKQDRVARQQVGRRRRSDSFSAYSVRDELLDQIPDIDERIVSELVGREVRYGDHGQVETSASCLPAELDLSKFEMLKDLYWWYCKQDVYQSIVSGNPLLMDFSRYADCPPRTPLGKPDAVYGSFDHLILLLARIADFSCRDRERKLRVMELNGGIWKPPGSETLRPPQHAPQTPRSVNGTPDSHSQTSPARRPQMPDFYGMAPPPRQNVHMPASYGPIKGTPRAPHQQPRPQPQAPSDLHQATQAATAEYGHIRSALRRFEQSLGEAFQPLSSEYQPALPTPFGDALFYRSYDIGCLWAVYYMAVIIAIRSQPHMPPAAHVAAGVAAQETRLAANEIGRIAAGIVPGPPDQALNPSLGAALCESCMPSFFAAIQYQDPRQRHETVTRIFAIAQRTGWGSAELIANGCETAWVKSAAAGRGPPYTRIARQKDSPDPRMNGSWEELDMKTLPAGVGLDGRSDAGCVDEEDRRLVRVRQRPESRLHWAFGIMGTEEDVRLVG